MTTAGPLALVGSGEYLPGMVEVDRELLAGRAPVMVQIPTAAAPEGEASLRYWVELGARHARRLGVRAVPVVARDREQAQDPALAARLAGAGLVYLSGGNPVFLADTLRGTALAAAVLRAWAQGAALAGCSAGAMALAAVVPGIRHPHPASTPGLGVVPGVVVVPHFDRFLPRRAELLPRLLAGDGPFAGTSVLGIDEDTAVLWDGSRWSVRGRGQAWRVDRDGRTGFPAGSQVALPAPEVPPVAVGASRCSPGPRPAAGPAAGRPGS